MQTFETGEVAVRSNFGADMAIRIGEFPWETTPLGRLEDWPQSLKTVVQVMLTSRFAMWMAWGENLTFFCNDAYLPTVGVKREWVLGAPSDLVWSEIWPDIGPRIDHVLRTGEATWDEALLLYLERSGFTEETYHTFSYSPLCDDSGNVAGMLCVVAEVTDKVIGERQLALLRNLGGRLAGATTRENVMRALEAALATESRDIPLALVFLNAGSGPSLAARHGLEGETGLAEAKLWPFDQVTIGGPPFEVALNESDLGGFTFDFWQKPPHRALVAPIRGSGGNKDLGYLVAGLNPHRAATSDYMGFIELIAAQVAAALARADEYERANERAAALVELDKAKTAFFSNVSHEFRTPLTLMLGPLEDALADSAALTCDLRDHLRIAHRNALRLLRLVNALLDFSRIEAGRLKAEFEATDLATFTADLASSFRSAMDRAGLQFIVDTSPLSQMPFVDRQMWETIVLNLVSNAFKFTLQGQVRVELREVDDGARLVVRDTGLGIPAPELENLFNRFHRVEGTKGRSYEGTGIGLALVQELVKQHGGRIAVESEEGAGSTFSVTIPFGNAHLPADQLKLDSASFAQTSIKAPSFVEEALRWLPSSDSELPFDAGAALETDISRKGAPRHIVVADDNADLRDYIARLLAGQGYIVQAVSDGEEALAAIEAHRPDLLVTDVMMPRLNGVELVARLRADDGLRDLPIIMLSARAGEDAKVEGLGTGADDYLTKPFSTRELLARVAANIAASQIRREMTVALSESEERFRNMADHAPVMMWVTDAGGSCTYLNRAWYEFTGQSREHAEGFGWLDATHPDDRTNAKNIFKADNANAAEFRLEYRLRRRDGMYRWAIYAAAPRFGTDNAFLGYVGSVVDIHERKLEQAALEQRVAEEMSARTKAEEQLRQVQKMEAMGQLTGGVAHDFNNLLTPIVAVLDMLRRKGLGGEREARLIDAAMESADRARLLVQRLLAFARRQPLQVVGVDVGQLVLGMRDLIESTLGPRIELQIEVDDALPNAKADSNQLEMALLNLAVNARDAMPNGGALRISAGTEHLGEQNILSLQAGRYVRLSVADNGFGMDQATMARAIEPFFSTKGVGKGTGLGLSMAHGVASQLGGSLRIVSTLGAGTTVDLLIPETDVTVVSVVLAPEKPSVSANGKVLLVDDEALIRLSTAHLLTDLGFAVVEVSCGEEALDEIRAGHAFDLIITDHLMPGMSGVDLAKAVSLEHPQLPILLLSGYADLQGVAADVPLLTKPFREDELTSLIGKLLKPEA